jgi:ankyrin repeat protein
LPKNGTGILERLAGNKTADAALVRDLVAAVGPDSAEAAEAIYLSTRRGNAAPLRALLEAGAVGPDKKTTVNDALFLAVEDPHKDKSEVVAVLLQHGANPGARLTPATAFDPEERTFPHGTGALHIAALYGQSKTVALLLKAGAAADMTDRWGSTPLFRATTYALPWKNEPERQAARLETAKLLLKAGADPLRETNKGRFPFLDGLWNPELTALFLRSPKVKAKVNAVAGSGWTPLTWAANDKDWETTDSIPLLLTVGADPKQPDGEGRLPLDVALEAKNSKAAAWLAAGRPAGSGRTKSDSTGSGKGKATKR